MTAVFAAMMTAIVTVFVMVMIMVIAVGSRVVRKRAGQIGSYRIIRKAGDARVKLDACLGKGLLGSEPNAAADQHIYMDRGEKTGQSPMAVAIGAYNGRSGNLTIGDIINLHLLSVAKVLENRTIFISNSDAHFESSFVFMAFMVAG